MDIYSAKFAIMIIIILLAILTFQVISNDKRGNTLIDSETCELYVVDSQINARKYLGEFDSKCLDFKNLNP